MKIHKKRIDKKKIYIILLLIALLLTAISLYLILSSKISRESSSTTSAPIDYSPPSNQQAQTGEDIKKDRIKDKDIDPVKQESDPANQSTLPTLELIITNASQIGDTVQIKTLLSSVTDSGTCELLLTNSMGVSIKKQSEVYPNPSSSTCKGFNVPVAELSPGLWTISLSYSGSIGKATASSEVEVR